MYNSANAIEHSHTPTATLSGLAHKISLITDLQLSMYESISRAVNSPSSPHFNEAFLAFLSEVQSRMKDLILSLGSLTKAPLPAITPHNYVDRDAFFMYKLLQNSQKLCKALSESQSILDDSFEHAELLNFFKRSVVFYKQTKIVLRAHLRVYRAN